MSALTQWIERAVNSLVHREPRLRKSDRRRGGRANNYRFQCRGFEPLEDRRMLAADVMSQIAGTVFNDLTDNGYTSDDVAISDATIRLYADGGNGVFGGDDTLVDTTTTGGDGKYAFRGVGEGRYFVQQVTRTGYAMDAGAHVRTIDITASAAGGRAGTTIDNFGSVQSITARSNGTREADGAKRDSVVLGGERDLAVEVVSGVGVASLESDFLGLGVLQFSSNGNAVSRAIVTWDGADADGKGLDATGLGGVDLTSDNGGLMTGFRLLLGADQAGAELDVVVYTNAANWSKATVAIPATGGAADNTFTIGFDEFTVGGGAGADFTNVGAIQLVIGSGAAAIDSQVALTGTIGPTVFDADFANVKLLSLGDLVWGDNDNDGLFDARTERGIANVLVDLHADTDGSGDYTAGVDAWMASARTDSAGRYRFDGLRPGDYVVKISKDNFDNHGPLSGLKSSKGDAAAPDPDDDARLDDNGYYVSEFLVAARAVTLSTGAEPKGDGDDDDATNMTVDFGFFGFDLVLDKMVNGVDGPVNVLPGDEVIYTVRVTNTGPSTATDVTFTDVLPSNLAYQSGTTSLGTSVIRSGNQLSANLGSMEQGDVVTVTIRAIVGAGASGRLVNTARVSAPLETNLTNNVDDAVIQVTPKIDLAIVKSESADPVKPGDTFFYTLQVTNNGPSNATGVTIVDALPARDLTFVGASMATASVAGSELTFYLGDMAVGASRSVTVNVRVNANATPGVLTNTARVFANEAETTLANNQDSEQTTIRIPPARVGGYVYVDADNDGRFDSGEAPIVGVQLTLTGVASDGTFVSRTTTTAANGSYLFDNLPPGDYRITETQPARYLDGLDTLGSHGGIVGRLGASTVEENNDVFDTISLSGGDNGVNYNFGELAVTLTKRDFMLA